MGKRTKENNITHQHSVAGKQRAVGIKKLKMQLKKYKNEFLVGILLFFTLISSIFTSYRYNQRAAKWALRQQKEQELQHLIDLSNQYPDYRDLLYQLAITQWELGNDQEAANALSRAQYLDPNNPQLTELIPLFTDRN